MPNQASQADIIKLRHYLFMLAIPVLLILGAGYLTVIEFKKGIESAENEKEGLHEIYTFTEAINVLQSIRGLNQIKSSSRGEVVKRLNELREQFRNIVRASVVEQHAVTLGVRDRLNVILTKFEEIGIEPVATDKPLKDFKAYSYLVEELKWMISDVARSTELITDPVLKSYELIVLITRHLPDLSEDVARIRGLKSYASLGAPAHDRVRQELELAKSYLYRDMKVISRAINVIGSDSEQYNIFGELVSKILKDSLHYSDTLVDVYGAQQAIDVFENMSIYLENINELERIIHIQLSDILSKRIEVEGRLLAIIIVAMLLAILASVLLVLYLYNRNRIAFSEMVLAKEKLAASVILHRSIFETVADGVIVIDDKGIVSDFNLAAEKIFEYPAAEVLGKNIKMLMPAHFSDNHDEYLHRYLATGDAQVIGVGREVEGLRKSGTVFPLDLAISEMLLDGQRFFTGIVRDISDRKDVEAALYNAEVRQRAILENIVDGIITIDDKGIISSFNHAAEEIFGYDADTVIGSNVNILMPEPYMSQHDGYLHNYMESGVKKIIGIGREVEGLRQDGTVFPLDLAVSEMTINGRRMFSGIVRDITERKRIERMKNEFVSTVSHELRTPLTAIRGSLGLISSGVTGELPEKVADMLKIASNNTERLLILINDILDMQKIESGKISFTFLNIALSELLEQVVKDNQSYAREHNVSIKLIKKVDGARVFADKDRLMQVMANLLSNAAKFSPPGEVVEVSVARHNDRLRISVTDNGEGIPEEFRDKLFEQFTQSDSSTTRSKGGTGLGLSISKVIIEKHGGEVGFVSEMGIGTTFFVDLPELSSDETNSSIETPRKLVTSKGACILIIEDDHDIAALIRRMLAEEGYNCDVAYSAVDALAILERSPDQYRAITLDLILPGMDGVSFLNTLRKNEHTRHIPVVVVSVKASETKRNLEGAAISVSDWLQKPIDHDRLIKAVQQAAGPCGQPKVLHVEDEKDIHEVVKGILQNHCELTWTTTLSASKEAIESKHFDLVLLDIGLPDGSGLDLLDRIKNQVPTPRVVIFSAYDVSDDISRKVDAVLAKSTTSNLKLADVINEIMNGV